MKKIVVASLAAAGLCFTAASAIAMPAAVPEAHSMAQNARDPACNAVKGRCQWYGMPGVHHGPKWLRQHGGEGYKHHHHHYRHHT